VIEIQWLALGAYIFLATIVGLVIYHVVAGYYHVRYYVRRKHEPETWKCQIKRWLPDRLARKAALAGTLNMTLGGVLSGIFIYAVAVHDFPTRLYYDIAEHGWPYAIASTVAVWILIDLMAYYIHRILHIRWIFKRVHYFHHKFVATNSYTAAALHPVELIALQSSAFLMIFIVPMHPAAIGGILIYNLIFNIIDHSGVDLTSQWPWQGPSRYHDDHHAYFHCNFGQHLTLWDRLHGTLRREGRAYGKNAFGGRGVQGEHETQPPPFVQY
jgi:Delta7-sterol 5-desaturase